ncbi:MAG: M36 family metallopeptidase, partial [Bacteroidota bacterium]
MKLFIHLLVTLILALPFHMSAQKIDAESTARKYLQTNKAKWQLTDDDLQDMVVSDQYLTKHNGVQHVYFKQRYKGIPLYNAIANVHLLKDGNPFYATSNFTPNLSEKVNTTAPSLLPEEAIWRAVDHLKIKTTKAPELIKRTEEGKYIFTAPNISNSDIEVELTYQKMSEEEVRLAWGLAINMLNSADYWSIRIDALTGEVLHKGNYTVYCNHDHHNRDASCSSFAYNYELPTFNSGTSSTYNVFPFPAESPVHGERALVSDPADLMSSPFGWHDTNGQEGAEFTITRGNNVHAFQDRDTTDRSSGDEPDGGDSLFFDFPYDPTLEPATATDFATVQLFYANNYIHDFTYAYGLDEAAGNFQSNNYDKGGRGGDYVLAQAQDGGGVNNANFGTPPDGGNGVMQMFLWNRNSGDVQVDAPGSIAGIYETRRPVDFGPNLDTIEISGEAVLVNDGVGQGTLGCNPILNDLTGKVAIVDRGECFFTTKVWNAELQGAVGVIICNFDGGSFGGMSAGTNDPITIPSVMVNFADCQRLK